MRYIFLLCALCLAGPGSATGEVIPERGITEEASPVSPDILRDAAALFGDGPPLTLRVEGPWHALVRERSHRNTVPGRLAIIDPTGGEASLDVSITPRGMSRLKSCANPLLSFEFEPEQVAPAGHRVVHAVTQCKRSKRYEQYLIREYLVYRAYSLISDVALGVRLARVDFVDSDGRHRPGSGLMFLLEDYGEAAERLGAERLALTSLRRDDLDPAAVTLTALFQFMVGNTDWSVLVGPEGAPCCHNTIPLRVPAKDGLVPLPFDFDSSGLVDVPYAVPSDKLKITSVRQRLYRGFCQTNPHLENAVAVFQQRRANILALSDDPLLSDNSRKSVDRYLADFYRILDDPAKFQREIVQRCR